MTGYTGQTLITEHLWRLLARGTRQSSKRFHYRDRFRWVCLNDNRFGVLRPASSPRRTPNIRCVNLLRYSRSGLVSLLRNDQALDELTQEAWQRSRLTFYPDKGRYRQFRA